ncbi:hypothetical protein [Agaricicola taiwanensis]|nr:hypothetical protein [Agaricicola taiwanensis]
MFCRLSAKAKPDGTHSILIPDRCGPEQSKHVNYEPGSMGGLTEAPRAWSALLACDEDYGRRVAEGAGIDLKKAKALARCRASPRRVRTGRPAPPGPLPCEVHPED